MFASKNGMKQRSSNGKTAVAAAASAKSFHLDRKSRRKKGCELTSFSFVLATALLVVGVIALTPIFLVHRTSTEVADPRKRGNGDSSNGNSNSNSDNSPLLRRTPPIAPNTPQRRRKTTADETPPEDGGGEGGGACLRSFSELTLEERYPTKGDRHAFRPPPPSSKAGEREVLVCCRTTAGPLSIVVRPTWAPVGAAHFLDLVRSGEYFSSRIALMRCVRNFICQFGIAGDPRVGEKYRATLRDDPNWLLEGPDHRTNERGVKRFARGYLAYAGSGKNSRGNQFIVALRANERLGGGSPWEVPWGELVGKTSFDTLDAIYTGYGEKGPSQALLGREGSSKRVARDFPKLDYVTDCSVTEEMSEQ